MIIDVVLDPPWYVKHEAQLLTRIEAPFDDPVHELIRPAAEPGASQHVPRVAPPLPRREPEPGALRAAVTNRRPRARKSDALKKCPTARLQKLLAAAS